MRSDEERSDELTTPSQVAKTKRTIILTRHPKPSRDSLRSSQPKAISANSPAKVEGRASPEGNRGAGVNEVLTKGSRGGKGQTVGR